MATSLPVIIAVVDRRAKLDETLVEGVRHRADALRHDHDGLPIGSLKVQDVALAVRKIRPKVRSTCSRWLGHKMICSFDSLTHRFKTVLPLDSTYRRGQ